MSCVDASVRQGVGCAEKGGLAAFHVDMFMGEGGPASERASTRPRHHMGYYPRLPRSTCASLCARVPVLRRSVSARVDCAHRSREEKRKLTEAESSSVTQSVHEFCGAGGPTTRK